MCDWLTVFLDIRTRLICHRRASDQATRGICLVAIPFLHTIGICLPPCKLDRMPNSLQGCSSCQCRSIAHKGHCRAAHSRSSFLYKTDSKCGPILERPYGELPFGQVTWIMIGKTEKRKLSGVRFPSFPFVLHPIKIDLS